MIIALNQFAYNTKFATPNIQISKSRPKLAMSRCVGREGHCLFWRIRPLSLALPSSQYLRFLQSSSSPSSSFSTRGGRNSLVQFPKPFPLSLPLSLSQRRFALAPRRAERPFAQKGALSTAPTNRDCQLERIPSAAGDIRRSDHCHILYNFVLYSTRRKYKA